MLLYFLVYVIASISWVLGQSSLDQTIGNYQQALGSTDGINICTYLVYQPFLYVGTLTSIGVVTRKQASVQVYIVRPVDDNNAVVKAATVVTAPSGLNTAGFPVNTQVIPGDIVAVCAVAGTIPFGADDGSLFPVINQGENDNIPTTVQAVGSNLAFSYQSQIYRLYAIQAFYTVTEQWMGNTIELTRNAITDTQSECYFLTSMTFPNNATNIGFVGYFRKSISNFYVYIMRPSVSNPASPLVVAQQSFLAEAGGVQTGFFTSDVVAQTDDYVAFCSPSSGSIVFKNEGSATSGDPVVQIVEVNVNSPPLTVNKQVTITGNAKYRTYAFGIRYKCAAGVYPISPTHCNPCPLDEYCPGANVVTACGAPSGVNRYTLALGQYEAESCFIPPKPLSSALVNGFMKLTFQIPNDFKDRGSLIHLNELRYTVGFPDAVQPFGSLSFLSDSACTSTLPQIYVCTIPFAFIGGFPSDNTIYIWFVSSPSTISKDPHILDTQRKVAPLIPHLSFSVLSIKSGVCTSFDGIAFPISFCDASKAKLTTQPPTSPAGSVDAPSSGSSSTSVTDVLMYTLYAAGGLIGLCFAFCGLAYLPEIISTCGDCCGHSKREEKHSDTGKNEESALL